MKKFLLLLSAAAICFAATTSVSAQTDNLNFVHIIKLKTKWPENGSMKERDSLIAIYNDKVIKNVTQIISHREYSHYFTMDSHDYLIIDEYKDFAAMEAADKAIDELEKKAWPDEKQRKAFMDALDQYFDNGHGDMLFRTNPKVNKN